MVNPELYQEFIDAREHVEACEAHFNEMEAHDMLAIDIAIHELHAAELRLSSIIKQMKNNNEMRAS